MQTDWALVLPGPRCLLLYNMGRLIRMTVTIHHRSISKSVPPYTIGRLAGNIFPPLPYSSLGKTTIATDPLACEREKIQLSSPSHSRSHGWPWFTAHESLATFVVKS
jgi:hypothetical protein